MTLEDPAGLAEAGFGDLLQCVSCVTWTVYTLVGVRAVEREGALRVACVSMLVASAVLAPVAAWRGLWHASPGTLEWGALAYLGLCCNAIAFTLWYRSQRVHGVHRTGATLYLEPFVTLVAAMLVLHEPFGPRAAVGGVVMLLGVWFVGRGSSA